MRLCCQGINHLKLLYMLQQYNGTYLYLTKKKTFKGKRNMVLKKKNQTCTVSFFSSVEANADFVLLMWVFLIGCLDI